MPTYQTRNPLAVYNPLRSMPFSRPAAQVFGPSAQTKAEWALAAAQREVEARRGWIAVHCAALGAANRVRGPMRRFWQAKAFREINSARAHLRAARRALVAAEAAMLAFAPAVAA